MKRALAIFIFLVVAFSLTAHDFNGEWYAKFELNEKYEEGAVFRNVVVEDDVIYINGDKLEFTVLNDFYLIFDGNRYSYSTRKDMLILYREDDEYKFNRILFLKPLRE